MSTLTNRGLRFIRRIGRDERLLFAATALAILLTRIPFLGVGFGRDPDAWRLVYAGQQIAATGAYNPSRLPGFPLPEFAYALLFKTSLLNLPHVPLLGAVAIAFFVLIARRLGLAYPVLAGFAVAFTPIVYVSATNVMDYTWTLAAVLAAYYALVCGRPLLAGILCGLAVATRMTSLVMLVPFTLVLVLGHNETRRGIAREIARLWLAAVLVGAGFYVPGLAARGLGLFAIIDVGRPIADALATMGPHVWGSVGLAALLLAVVVGIVPYATGKVSAVGSRPPDRAHVVAWVATLVIYIAVFLRLPHEAGYLIVAVPFVVLLLGRFLDRWAFAGFCVLLCVSPFLEVGRDGPRIGTVIETNWVQASRLDKSREIIAEAYAVEGDKVAVMVGTRVAQLRFLQDIDRSLPAGKQVRFLHSLRPDKVAEFESEGWYVYTNAVHVVHPENPGLVWYATRFAHPVFIDWNR